MGGFKVTHSNIMFNKHAWATFNQGAIAMKIKCFPKRIIRIIFLMPVMIFFVKVAQLPAMDIELLGRVEIPTSATNLFVSGTYTYIADYGRGLRVLNVSDPTHPFEVGADESETVTDVNASGGYAYVVGGGSGFRVLNIADPSHITETGSWDRFGYDSPTDVFVSENMAYVVGGSLVILDISNPWNPSFKGGCDLFGGRGYDIVVSGSYAYVVGVNDTLEIINVYDPAHPFVAGIYDTPDDTMDQSQSVFVDGSFAYVTFGNAQKGLRIVNIFNPANPIEVGAYDFEPISSTDHAQDIYVSGNYAYVATSSNGLRILNISDPANPSEVVSYEDTNWYAHNVFVSGDLIYVLDSFGRSGFSVFQFITQDRPTISMSPAEFPEFQLSILDGNGFVIHIRDEDGIIPNFAVESPLPLRP